MTFTTNIENFLNTLQKVERFTGKNLTLPTLSYILVEATGSSIKLRATNLQLGIEFEVPAKIDGTASFAIEGSILVQALGNTKKEKEITGEFKDGVLHITTSTSSIKLRTQAYDDFPTLPTINDAKCFSIDSKDLSHGIKSVAYSAAINDIKPEIASVYLYTDENNLVFVATDSFRLAEKKIQLENSFEMKGIMIPVKNAIELSNLCDFIGGKISLCVSDDLLSISSEYMYVTSRLVEGVFPDYRQILPTEFTTEAVVLSQDLQDGMKSAIVFSDKQSQVDISFKPKDKKMIITSENPDRGEIKTQIDASLTGDDLVARVNYKYVMEMFSGIDKDSIIIGGTEQQRPILIRPVGDQSFLYLIMPMNR